MSGPVADKIKAIIAEAGGVDTNAAHLPARYRAKHGKALLLPPGVKLKTFLKSIPGVACYPGPGQTSSTLLVKLEPGTHLPLTLRKFQTI